MTPITVTVPVRTGQGLNGREHHMTRARRVKKERNATAWALITHRPPAPGVPIEVLMTRHGTGTRGLDSDNLQGSLKALRDQVATWLRRDDADPSITWRYDQRTRAPRWSVEVQIREAVK